MLSLVFLLITPLNALQVAQEAEQPQLKLKYYVDGTVDVLNKTQGSHGSIGSAYPVDRTERVLRKIGKNNHAWVVFVGDSNMRGAYSWWVTEQAKNPSVKFHKSKQFRADNPWSDQEAVLEYPDGFEARLSYRFLHGSEHEYKFKMTNWHKVSKIPTYEHDDKDIRKARSEKLNITMDEHNAVPPSEYALWAAAHGKFVDFHTEMPMLAKRFEKYDDEQPSAVVLTEGWGGLPGCERFDETLDLFKQNSEMKFVWSPIFVTNRQERRHKCFSEKMAGANKNQNFKFVDMWDLSSNLPPQKEHLKKDEWYTPTHIRAGGDFMRTACERFEDAIDELSQ